MRRIPITRRRAFRPRVDRLEPLALMANLPAGFAETAVASGLTNPTALEFAPDGLLFVAEQGGTMEVFRDGARLQANFFRDAPITVDPSGERGLLGVTLDPDFATNRFVYVYYTATTPVAHNRLSRFTADASGTLALAGSQVVLLDVDPLSSATNHNGGAIHFGPDGKLYAAVGDNATGSNAQTLGNLKGKILRLNPDGSIPADNPFFAEATGRNRAIWALGLRNPFTFSFQPGTGRMFINDVGQSAFEEIDEGAAGANFGWPATEGATTNPDFVGPFYSYGRSEGQAITGGAFYNPATNRFPADYAGDYFFADFVAGTIRRIDTATKAVTAFASAAEAPVDLRVRDDGALYYLSRGLGQVLRVDVTAPQGQPPTITQQPAGRVVSPGEPATFAAVASGTGPLGYQWQRDGANIPGATAASYTIASPTIDDNGRVYRLIVTNGFGTIASEPATLTVTTNRAPVAAIAAPALGARFNAGDTIAYAGSATDPEDGPLPASAFSWRVDYFTNTVERPFVPLTAGVAGGSFTIPTVSPYTLADVFYRVTLTVTDSGGRTATATRDLAPNTSRVTLRTEPPGLQLFLDGQPYAAPTSFVGVVGLTRPLDAPEVQAVGGATYAFAGWSDGGASSHDLATPASDSTLTATYRLVAARINFQPARSPVPAGYEADGGDVFGPRARGLSFGWNAKNSATARDLNARRSPDQRYDTFQLLRRASSRWEIAVPDGTYAVRVVAGDPRPARVAIRFRVEGAPAVRARTTRAARWIDRTVTVTVTDGRLTIGGAPGVRNRPISFVEIARISG